MIVVTDPDEFMDITFALAYMPLPPGRRWLWPRWVRLGVLVSDEISRCGLELAELSPEVIESLNKHLPPFWSHSNPWTWWRPLRRRAGAVVETLVASEGVDAVIVMACGIDEREPEGDLRARGPQGCGGSLSGTEAPRPELRARSGRNRPNRSLAPGSWLS